VLTKPLAAAELAQCLAGVLAAAAAPGNVPHGFAA
jgi:hypothetical protein